MPGDGFYAKLAAKAPRSDRPADVTPIATPTITQRPTSLALLPKPFAWMPITAGQVTLEAGGYIPKGGKTFSVAAFPIAKYPVTNAQFGKFCDVRGYDQQEWWTSEGWQIREKEGWAEPRYWQDTQWNKNDHPVVGVSWYEAVAFCHWLSDKTGENITLPTEQQWQRAAQGDTNRVYPWGDEFDQSRCNVGASGTTAVTHYEGSDKGDSPFGVVDMSGNGVRRSTNWVK